MNIGVDARPLTYLLTGIGVYLKHLLEALQTVDDANHYYLISNGPILLNLHNPKWSKIQGRLKKKLLSTLWMQSWAPVIAGQHNLDIFWSPRHHLPILLPSRLKTVLTIHDITHRLFPETMALPNLLVEKLLMHLSLRRADCVIAVSETTRKGLVDNYAINPAKITTVLPGKPHLPTAGLHRDTKRPELPARFFLFVGTLDPRKNLVRVLKAFEQIKPDNHNIYLVIVGEGGWKINAFKQFLRSYKKKDRVMLAGYVSRASLKFFYEKAICLLFPSLYEGFGFPILEAMSCGTPVITSETSSMPEVAAEAAILVNPNDISAIAAAMSEILTNSEMRRVLVARGYQRAADFSWRKCAQETLRTLLSA